ncbi:hypothetical protein [Telmatospirillum siberiense]|uniref:Carotenoid 1,2-hydratase n=1 Tax=Telmatospirillum siberiense TaxID=382514 RepID=A0A2N3PTK0_9PROT|nr:hypothetical protein [Telmatospirillum siberiense]PKU23717.1 hypothetical protein CWS72_15440 [Telmatospirillum siberiense]
MAADFGPAFDTEVPSGGYLWWYLDGLSDDHRFAITLIAFVGSSFSPYYAWAGRRDPLNHCCINVALYGQSAGRWAMTERARDAVERTPASLRIGPSVLVWRDGALAIGVDELAFPVPRRIRGTIRMSPKALPATCFRFDGGGGHVWQPIAPRARIEVDLLYPKLRWSGDAYFDANCGQEPLEDGFRHWSWARAHRGGDSVILYDARRRDGGGASLALRFASSGAIEGLPPLPMATLSDTAWRLGRTMRADSGSEVLLRSTLEDTPFYARSLLEASLYGESALAFHECLSLDRFRSNMVRAMLPFRMPRAGRLFR